MALLRYLLRRLVTMVLTLIAISALVFFIIKLPPGDYLTNQIAELSEEGDASSLLKAQFLRHQFGLDLPVWQQYLAWVGLMPGPNGWSGLLQGNWGWSFEYNQPVNLVVGQALLLTLVVNLAAVVFVHIVAIPIAIYSAVRQYSIGDYLVTFIGYIGLATPSFLLALVLLYYLNRWFGVSIGGLMDRPMPIRPGAWTRCTPSPRISSCRPSSSGSPRPPP